MLKSSSKSLRRFGAAAMACVMTLGSGQAVFANYTTSFVHNGIGSNHEIYWSDNNTFASEGVDFSSQTVGQMMEEIEAFDFEAFANDHSDLPWLDELLVQEGVIPDDISDDTSANTMFSRGSALYMKTNVSTSLGFVGQPYYADTLNQSSMYTISLSGRSVTENTSARANYPSHMAQEYTSTGLNIQQKKYITYGNTAVTLLTFENTTSSDITFTVNVQSPFVSETDGDELLGKRVASPLMVGVASNLDAYVEAMSYVDVRINGTGMTATQNNTLTREITVPAGQTVDQKVVMGWLAEEIPQSYTDYEEQTDAGTEDAFEKQVIAYNQWWAENIPYIDIPDEDVKKVIYYRWWCNRFNFLEANIPGNDWQFPMNMEGVLGYNNGITVSVAWAMQDIKWLRDPTYAYGTWMSQGEYSKGTNYKNNPGRPNTWTWDMMQNISQVGWEAYKIHGGGDEILKKFADYSSDDVYGSLSHFSAPSGAAFNNPNLIYYNHGPMTGNDGDTVSMHWNTASGGSSFARVDGSATIYANAYAAGEMYEALGDTANADAMYGKAADIQEAMLTDLWYDDSKFPNETGEDADKADTNGEGSFLHRQANTGLLNPWRDNNMFAFSMGVVPIEGEDGYDEKYKTQLYDYGDEEYYPVFPFFTADQTSIEKRVQAWIDGDATAYGTNQFAWCNFGNYINILRSSLRYYPVDNITSELYSELFDWGAWLHTVNPGETDYLDSNEFFWLTDYYFGTNWTADNPPSSTGNMVRAWIHHDTLGMMDYTVIEDMAGLQPREDDKIELWPLGVDYDYFTVDNIRYHDSDLTIVWQDPDKAAHYDGIPTGYSLYIDSELVMTTDEMSHVIYDTATGKVEFPQDDVEGAVSDNSNTTVLYEKGSSAPIATAQETSLADNDRVVDLFNRVGIDLVNDGENLAMASTTNVTASYVSTASSLNNMINGDTGVSESAATNLTSNTTSFRGTPNEADTISFAFDTPQTVDNVKLYFFNDRLKNGYTEPQAIGVEYLDGDTWKPVTGQQRSPELPRSNYNNIEFAAVTASELRVTITHATNGYSTALTEIQVFNNNLGITGTDNDNTAPVVIMPDDTTAEVDAPLTLVPVVSDDGMPNGTLSYEWKLVGTDFTEGTDFDFLDGSDQKKDLSILFYNPGDYTFDYTVSDGELETTVRVIIEVDVATSYLREMMERFSDTAYLQKNAADYETTTFTALRNEIARIEALLDAGNYTGQDIKDATESLQAYIDALVYLNVALLATPTTNYVSSWEDIEAVNDGFIPLSSYKDETRGDLAYGNWGGSANVYWVEYTWDEPVTITGASTYFYNDSGGIGQPGSYYYEYYDEQTNTYVTPSIKEASYPNVRAVFNEVTFTEEITTSKFRIQMEKAGTDTWNGIKEFRVLGHTNSSGEIEGEIVSIAPISVETVVNVIPDMPSTVMATYDNGRSAFVPVTWPDLTNYVSTATTHTINGTVEGTDIPAICTLYVRYDKSELRQLIEVAQSINQNRSDYPDATAAQWDELTDALAAAETVEADDNATQASITDAVTRLRNAIMAIEASVPLDTAELEAAIDRAQRMIDNKADYPNTSDALWTELEEVLAESEALLANSNTVQREIEEAAAELLEVIQKVLAANEADKTALRSVLATATSNYISQWNYQGTDEQWQALDDAIAKANEVLADIEATDAEIQDAVDALIDALTDLKLVNMAILATASSACVASWNSVAAVNDGIVSDNLKSNVTPGGNTTNIYANWGVSGDQIVVLTWDTAVKLTDTSILFFDDREGNPDYTGQTLEEWVGVGVPLSYVYEYLDESGSWVALDGAAGYGNEVDQFNTTTFQEPIVTTAIRIHMERNGQATGIIEWLVNGEPYAGESALPEIKVDSTVENGYITYNPKNPEAGETVTVTLEPLSGYVLKEGSLKYNDTVITANADGAYTFVMPDEDVVLTAKFIADMSELQAYVDELEALDTSKYTPESWAELQAALDNAKLVLSDEDSAPSQVNAAYDALLKAQLLLVSVDEVDKTYLEELINQAKAIDTSGLRPNLVADLEAALAAAEQVYNDANATKNEVYEAAADLLIAIINLKEIIDRSDIERLLELLELLDEEDYTAGSWSNLMDAVEQAQKLDDNASQKEVDDAYSNLRKAYQNLEKVDRGPNKDSLKQALDDAKLILDNIDSFIPSTVDGLKEIYDKAMAVYENDNATQAEINEVTRELAEANARARIKEDKSALERAVEEAKALDPAKYTAESYAVLEKALEEAQKVLEDEEATAEEIAAALKLIEDARVQLKLVDSGSGGSGQSGGDTSTGGTDGTDGTDGSGGKDSGNAGTGDTMNLTTLFLVLLGTLGGCLAVIRRRGRNRS